ncbi:hypothetical protein ERO13_A10G215584v2 [Gossypium hirsutum]|nr:hypothetical protein ERO13_A10G215584v2 [Gossypium hirsutum]
MKRKFPIFIGPSFSLACALLSSASQIRGYIIYIFELGFLRVVFEDQWLHHQLELVLIMITSLSFF